jgi:hypothetical protein
MRDSFNGHGMRFESNVFSNYLTKTFGNKLIEYAFINKSWVSMNSVQ